MLSQQTQTNADEALARRIRVIYKEFGGLGAFFDRLNQAREAQSQHSENRVKLFDVSLPELAKGREKGANH